MIQQDFSFFDLRCSAWEFDVFVQQILNILLFYWIITRESDCLVGKIISKVANEIVLNPYFIVHFLSCG